MSVLDLGRACVCAKGITKCIIQYLYKINFLNSQIQTQLYTLKAYLSHTTKTKHGVMCVKILLCI